MSDSLSFVERRPGEQLVRYLGLLGFRGWFRNYRVRAYTFTVGFPEQRLLVDVVGREKLRRQYVLRLAEAAASGYRVLPVSEDMIGTARLASLIRRAIGEAPVRLEEPDAGQGNAR